MTVTDILRLALIKAQAIKKGEYPSQEELADSLLSMTVMLHSWSARRLMVRATVEESKVLTISDGSYTIGVGAYDIIGSKPFSIVRAFIRDSSNVDTPVDIVSKDIYDAITDKTVTGRPDMLYYDAGLSQQASHYGTINLQPLPDAAYTLYINSTKPFTEVATVEENMTFEPPYEEAIVYGLAIRLWREYHGSTTEVPADMVAVHREAMGIIENMNATRLRCSTDLPGVQGAGYDINTGG